jgi:AcrR family transcriptional regulator
MAASSSTRVVEVPSVVVEAGVDGRPLPRASYLAGLADHQGPTWRKWTRSSVQRRMFVEAMQSLVVEWGFPGPNIQNVSDRAEIARDAFIKHFSDIGDCFRAALVQAEDDLRKFVGADLRRVRGSEARLDCAVDSVLRFAAREPVALRMVAVEAFGEAAVELSGFGEDFGAAGAWLAAQVGIGGPGAPGSLEEELAVCAVEYVLARRLAAAEGAVRADLVAEVAYFLRVALAGPGSVGDWSGSGGYGLEV